jgi:hypothetical protein
MFRRLKERIMGLLRLGAYGGFVFVGLACVAARSVYGDVGESSVMVGREFANMKELVAGSHRVRINGEEVFVRATTVAQPTNEILDKAEHLCRENSQGLDEVMQQPERVLSNDLRASLAAMGPLASGILRREAGGEGTVACLSHQGGGGIAGLGARLAAFGKSRDLADIGKIRYVYVRPTAGGKSQVITVWSEGSMRIEKLFPQNGEDAGGGEPRLAPRPPEGKRTLTAEIVGAPYAIHVFDSTATPAEVLAYYDKTMTERGFERSEEVQQAALDEARVYVSNDAQLMIHAVADGTRTAVSIIEMPVVAKLASHDRGQTTPHAPEPSRPGACVFCDATSRVIKQSAGGLD